MSQDYKHVGHTLGTQHHKMSAYSYRLWRGFAYKNTAKPEKNRLYCS